MLQQERYYLDITLNDKEFARREAFGKIMKIIHGISSLNKESKVAVGFPSMQSSSKQEFTTIGSSIRLVGSRFDLMVIYKNPYIESMIETFGIEIKKIHAVPEDESVEVLYYRDRYTENYKKDPRGQTQTKFFPFVSMQSGNSTKLFMLYIGLKEAGASTYSNSSVSYSTYGLAKGGSSFPLF